MILTGSQIFRHVENGSIVIDPFDRRHLGPNSYDFRLGDRCRTYSSNVLNAATENPTEFFKVSEAGVLLEPSRVYLFNTLETMGSTQFVPIIRGRSSVGRLGLFIDITADLIDLGSINQWTLQLHCVQPVRVFPGMLIGQVTFWKTIGEISHYSGKYGHLQSPVPSLSFKDFQQ